MKLRLGLILLLFAASAGILAWMYYAATREPRSPKGSPWAETLADLDACCRRKHVKSVQYDHFAGIAADEERHTAERLFRAMAFSERLQEIDFELYCKVREVLDKNLRERHIRGGNATKKKYEKNDRS